MIIQNSHRMFATDENSTMFLFLFFQLFPWGVSSSSYSFISYSINDIIFDVPISISMDSLNIEDFSRGTFESSYFLVLFKRSALTIAFFASFAFMYFRAPILMESNLLNSLAIYFSLMCLGSSIISFKSSSLSVAFGKYVAS